MSIPSGVVNEMRKGAKCRCAIMAKGTFSAFVTIAHHAGARYLRDPLSSAFEATLMKVFPSLDELRFTRVGANNGGQADLIDRCISRLGRRGSRSELSSPTLRRLGRIWGEGPIVRYRHVAEDNSSGCRTVYCLRVAKRPAERGC